MQQSFKGTLIGRNINSVYLYRIKGNMGELVTGKAVRRYKVPYTNGVGRLYSLGLPFVQMAINKRRKQTYLLGMLSISPDRQLLGF